jgi:hypothetical protein
MRHQAGQRGEGGKPKSSPSALVAQWIERRPPEPKVTGSNPVERAKFSKGVIVSKKAEPIRRNTPRGYPDLLLFKPGYGLGITPSSNIQPFSGRTFSRSCGNQMRQEAAC